MHILYEKEAEDFLQRHCFSVVKRAVATTRTQLLKTVKKLGLPVTLKIYSHNILHKSDVGGVKTDLRTTDDVLSAFNTITRIKGFEGVLAQKHTAGHFLILGLKKDPTFGHAVLIGSGGIYTEILKDVSFRVCPITIRDANAMIKELKIYPILKGARSEQPAHIASISTHLMNLSRLARQHPDIAELDINPLIANSKGCHVVDARIIFD